ncbi:MAG TPA: sulfite exporter TauE/SafE family protein [Vicinamibacteria bacterium]|nr:sulfite exporter TauE/SafE family protein [Vicinamibacteria bacterium]
MGIDALTAPALLLLVLVGAGTGLVGSLLGLGGGVFLVPLLTLALGVPIRAAVAASLACVIATASASATVNLGRGLVNMRLGLALEVATSVGGLAGGLTAARLSTQQLFVVFAATLSVMGVVMMLRSGRRNVIADTSVDPGTLGGHLREGDALYVYRVRRLPVAMFSSLVAGAISGLLGLGGGIIKVPVLNAFCGIPIRVAAATSTFMIGVTAAASAIVYFSRGDMALPLTAAVVLGALPGSLLGARLSDRVQARSLKVLMAVVLLVVGARMALEGVWR